LHVPFVELAARSGELDADALVVLYSWFQETASGVEVAMDLYRSGFPQVAVLEGGIQRWQAEGYPTEGAGLIVTPDDLGPPWTITPLAETAEPMTGTVTATAVLESSETPTATLTAGE
jgi:hypothetical protein